MILIAHRGNISGPNPEMENNPLYIDKAIERASYLWIHAKDIQALHSLTQQASSFNVFWHQDDFYTITTKGFIWTYPGHTLTPDSICVMPERFEGLYSKDELTSCSGVCTDFIEKYK